MKEKPSILVIDDEKDVRETICENLKSQGYMIFQAENGRKGIAYLKKKGPPCLVITDILMPEQEGLETIIEIRKKYPSVKLIAISGSRSGKNVNFLKMASALGADAVLPKPLDLDKLEKTVSKLMA